jgi:hypothetical protein
MIIMAMIGGVIVVVFAWAGWHDYQQRRRGARASVTGAFIRQREIDRKKISENAGPDGGPGGI